MACGRSPKADKERVLECMPVAVHEARFLKRTCSYERGAITGPRAEWNADALLATPLRLLTQLSWNP